jgi:DNA-binding Lrp family transcriptional regulator
MSKPAPEIIRKRLLEEWQRDFPLIEQPFEVIARSLGVPEIEVIEGFEELQKRGQISRVGCVVRPNTIGASTLAAIAAPDDQASSVAEIISAEPGVNHVYLRENVWNIWFVVTGPDRAYVDQTLRRISQVNNLRALDLRLEHPYHIDLGFPLNAPGAPRRPRSEALHRENVGIAIGEGDRELVQVLTTGLPLVAMPFKEIASHLGRGEKEILNRLKHLLEAGIIPRIGAIVRHRALGWASNAMAVWDVPIEDIDRAGISLGRAPGVTLCYRRSRYEREWPYNLYCMVHARTRQEALSTLAAASKSAGLEGLPHEVLFSKRCFKQTGAMFSLPREAA